MKTRTLPFLLHCLALNRRGTLGGTFRVGGCTSVFCFNKLGLGIVCYTQGFMALTAAFINKNRNFGYR